MLEAHQIEVGGFYVNEKKGLVREVWKEEDGDVYWRDYRLSTGEPIGSGVCSIYHLTRWSNRETTPEEAARLQRGHADIKDMLRGMEMINIVLKNVSDEQLLAEVRRRGLNINDEKEA